MISWKRESFLFPCKAEIQFLAEAVQGNDGLARCPLNGNEISCPYSFGLPWFSEDWQGVGVKLVAMAPMTCSQTGSTTAEGTSAFLQAGVPSSRPNPKLDFSSSSFLFHLPSPRKFPPVISNQHSSTLPRQHSTLSSLADPSQLSPCSRNSSSHPA